VYQRVSQVLLQFTVFGLPKCYHLSVYYVVASNTGAKQISFEWGECVAGCELPVSRYPSPDGPERITEILQSTSQQSLYLAI